jgi:hypothetical protein
MAAGLRPPSWIIEILKVAGNSPCWSEVVRYTKFQKDRSNGLKVMRFSKIQDGRRPAAAIFDFLKNIKLRVSALVGPKWYTKFQKDWSNGLKVIAITKIQDGRRPAAAILNF